MLTDRRPILLANARLIDPSRDLDIVGDVLIADGAIREAKRGIGAAGVPEGTEVVDCRGHIVAPGLIDMRAFIGEPGEEGRESIASASQAAPMPRLASRIAPSAISTSPAKSRSRDGSITRALASRIGRRSRRSMSIGYAFGRLRDSASSTAMRTATPISTCSRISDCAPSATMESISTPRFIGPGCITSASGLA